LIKRWLSNAAFLVVTIVVCCLILELGFRIVAGVPIFARTDWRAARVIQSDVSDLVQYDDLVGWVAKGGVKNSGYHTIDFGIRQNSADASDDIRQGGILVIGDSFASGSGVVDDQTWPAQLETIIHQPVLNAGVGGWGIDQMNLRVRQLVDATKPKIVILGGQDDAIVRLNFTSYERPKPYYSLQGAQLVLHNVPVPRTNADPDHQWTESLKAAMSYSYVLDRVIGRAAPAWWYTQEDKRIYKEAVSSDALGCALTKEIVKQSQEMGYRVIYLMQYSAQEVDFGSRPEFATKFEGCARTAGLQVIDDFDRLNALADKGPDALHQNYLLEGNVYGHMSAAGNRLVAELIAEALQSPHQTSNR
jgi:hypothetical protein